MNIQSISELTELTDLTLSQLSTATQSYIEVSWQNNNNVNVKQSCKVSIGNLVSRIVDELNRLDTDIKNISSSIDGVKNTYLPLSGGELTSTANLTCENIVIKGNLSCKTDVNIKNGAVTVENGILACTKDIKGCALSARWC